MNGSVLTRGYYQAAPSGRFSPLCSALEISMRRLQDRPCCNPRKDLHDRSCAVRSIWRQYQAVLSAASVAVPEAARFWRAANFFRSPNQVIVPQRAHILAVVLMKLSLRVQNLVLPGV